MIDLDRPTRIHVVNLGGAGMSAIATLLAQMGHHVSGVDDNETPFLPPLRALGVDVVVGDRSASASTAELVVVSTATPTHHPDVATAETAGAPVWHRAEALAAICARRRVLAVAGTHGKSTTAAMLATVLVHASAPGTGAGYLVGSRVTGLGTNADWRTGPGLVVEADESDGTFLRLGAHDAVVTNVEADHLAHWGTEERLVAAFGSFVEALPGAAVLCRDDPGSWALVGRARHPVTYGTDPTVDYHLRDIVPVDIGVRFSLHHPGGVVSVEVPGAPGIHNARNAAGALAAADLYGVDPEVGAAALAEFSGLNRRFEVRGRIDGITFVDSYDHLPTEVAAALAAARSGPFRRVVCVFQPHRYTRTRDLAPAFVDAFADADVLVVTELYAAGEPPIPGVSGRDVLDAVLAAHPDTDATFVPDLDAVVDWLRVTLRPGDLCITLNAGDLTTVPDRVLAALAKR